MGVNFAHRLQRLLKRKGLQQLDLAKKMGAAPSTINAIVNGKAQPRLKTMESVAKALDMSLAELLEGR